MRLIALKHVHSFSYIVLYSVCLIGFNMKFEHVFKIGPEPIFPIFYVLKLDEKHVLDTNLISHAPKERSFIMKAEDRNKKKKSKNETQKEQNGGN